MKKVLIPIDGSETSLRAIQTVIEKRARYRDPAELEVHIINVQNRVSGDVAMFITGDVIANYQVDQSGKALEQAKAMLDAAGLPYTAHEEIGHPAKVIADTAQALGCDQIIMATHGRGEIAGLLMGSVTRQVIHLAKVPILLIK